MADSSIAASCRIRVLDENSRWHGMTGIAESLIWQSMLDGSEVLASAICVLDNVANKVELKTEQVGLC